MTIIEAGTPSRKALATLRFWPMALEQSDYAKQYGTHPYPMLKSIADLIDAEAATPIELIPCEPRTFVFGDEPVTIDVQPLADYNAAIADYYLKRAVAQFGQMTTGDRDALVALGWTPPEEGL